MCETEEFSSLGMDLMSQVQTQNKAVCVAFRANIFKKACLLRFNSYFHHFFYQGLLTE